MVFNMFKQLVSPRWEPSRGKGSFVRAIPVNGRVLDVGCGNNSPEWFKTVRPDIYYVGLDIGDYNHANDPSHFADEYIVTSPDQFASRIDQFRGQMDAVVSCHNLEHCDDPSAVLIAMANALKPNGKLFLSFPCEESVSFPRRGGCLNFYDDSTHKKVPCWNSVLREIECTGCKFDFIAKRYRPFPLVLRGLFLEPLSAFRRQVVPDGSTWALYGFESVIWAAAPASEVNLGEWGPKETTKAEGINVQPDGASAMWIQASGLNRYGEVWVEFGGQRPINPAIVTENLLTTAIPELIIGKPGNHDVVVVESTGRKTKVGVFVVKP